MKSFWVVLLLLLLGGMSACATAPAMDPVASIIRSNCPWYKSCESRPWEQDFADKWHRPYAEEIQSLFTKYEAESKQATDSDYANMKKGPLLQLQIIRNDYINRMFQMIDEDHGQYQASVRQVRAFSDFYMDVAVLGITAAGAVVGGAPTKAILSATATALTGTKIAVNKAFFEEAAIATLLNQMDAARNKKKLFIRELMDKNALEYPLSNARADMLDYVFSGSMVAAVKTLEEDSATKKKESSDLLADQAKKKGSQGQDGN